MQDVHLSHPPAKQNPINSERLLIVALLPLFYTVRNFWEGVLVGTIFATVAFMLSYTLLWIPPWEKQLRQTAVAILSITYTFILIRIVEMMWYEQSARMSESWLLIGVNIMLFQWFAIGNTAQSNANKQLRKVALWIAVIMVGFGGVHEWIAPYFPLLNHPASVFVLLMLLIVGLRYKQHRTTQ